MGDRGKKFALCPAYASRNTRTKDGTTIKRLIQLQSVNTSHSYGSQFFIADHIMFIAYLVYLGDS